MAGAPGERLRTHYVGAVGEQLVGQTVTVAGWVHHRRDHGGLIFIDLRDRTGVVQVVVEPAAEDAFRLAESLRLESVVGVTGSVRRRPPGMENPELATGAVEIGAERLRVYARAKTPPFLPDGAEGVDELVRLRYRYLDLRRPALQANFALRDRVVQAVRRFFHEEGFWDVETPALARSTPEGARDFLVPSRLRPGHFYALPQSPQLFKQLLMVSGFDRYYQIVKVFRDEDLRADRQPEFTQIDVEASFLTQEEILDLMERMLKRVFKEALGVQLGPFPRLSYEEAMRRYGSDKPDLRAGPPLLDLTGTAQALGVEFLAASEAVAGVAVDAAWQPSRRELDRWVARARELGAPGLTWVGYDGQRWRSSAAGALGEAGMRRLVEAAGLAPGQWLLLVAGTAAVAYPVAGAIRVELAREREALKPGWHFLWVTDFPLFEWSEEEGRLVSAHHPFTMPHPDDLGRLESEPLRCRSQAYDVVLNGTEIASGSLRIYDPELQARIFRVLGMDEAAIRRQFGFLLEAFQYGAPPHGGIAFGLDRLLMLMAGARSIREVIAFPKTARGIDPMTEAPAPVEAAQLRELGIRLADEVWVRLAGKEAEA